MEVTPQSLRKYSRFLYPSIHRFNYGWDTPEGRRQVLKDKLLHARSIGTYRYLQKLTEKHLKRHLQRESTYYYTGTRNKHNTLLLCIDIDSHEGQSDALDVAKYLNYWWLDDSGYIEPSTYGQGIHLYFRFQYDEYTASKELKILFAELCQLMKKQVVYEGWESTVCMIGGLPTDWKSNVLATLIKLPRPQNQLQLDALFSLKIWTDREFRKNVIRVMDEHDAFKEHVSDQVSNPIPPTGVFFLHNDCNRQESVPPLLSPKHTNVIDEVKARHPLKRALWTVRTLAHVLGRIPTLMEAMDLYDRLQIGTGNATDARVSRFRQAIRFTTKTFDPSKRRSFIKLYPVLKLMIEKAITDHPDASITFESRKDRKPCRVSLESLSVGYYFALWQLAKHPTLPIEGIVAFNRELKEAKVVTNSIGYQKASAIRRILVDLGLLQMTSKHPKDYLFTPNRAGKALKYRLIGNQQI